ncbi:MAG: FprA family A-type flavoprotein [Candidatus Altiarchaeota archaeon]
MVVRELKRRVYSVGAIDWDRRLFDELIPLPDGTTYNAYIIQGSEKTALIDTVDPTKEDELVENLKTLGVKSIDYVISHHAEQDHSGAIPKILGLYPKAKVVTNQKCKELLKDMLHVPEERFITVKDGETLSLGDKTLQFMFTPWVHWPETMLTHLREERILFTCDFFGSHLASSDLYAKDNEKAYSSAKRYYAEIMMPFRSNIKSHLEKLKTIEFDIIATSHGPIYDKPKFILDAYKDWVSDDVKNEAIIAYVSMHGATRMMVEHLSGALMNRKVTVRQFNLARTDIGELAMALVDAATVIIATPTVLGGPHPAAVYAAYLANALRPKTRFATVIGSYEWGGRTVEQLIGMLGNLKVEVLTPVLTKGQPRNEDYYALDKLADQIAEKHKNV